MSKPSVITSNLLAKEKQDNGLPVYKYKEHELNIAKTLEDALNNPNRFQSIEERSTKTDHSGDLILKQSRGRYMTRYRGCLTMKSPEDVLIYEQLFETVKPKTIVEFGSYSGAYALRMADYNSLLPDPVDCKVYSVDIDPTLIDDYVKQVKPKNLVFIEGDCDQVASIFTHELLSTMGHPVVVIEDAHVNTKGVLEHLHPYLKPGDYIVVEDSNLALTEAFGFDESVLKQDVIKQFLTDYKSMYAVDSFYTDMFGYNYTWNMNGWIRKMKSE